MRSNMLDRLATVAAKGGFEAEKNLQALFCGRNLRSCSFLWTGDRDHQLYKDKVAAFTNSPPPSAAAQYTPLGLGLVDRYVSKSSLTEQLALCKAVSSFSLPIPQGMLRQQFDIMKFTAQFVVRYGFDFGMALTDRVSTDTRFQFLLATETRFMSLDKRDTCDVMYHFFCKLLVGYGCLIKEWENPPAGLEAVLQGFLTAFDAFRKKQDHEEEDELVDKEKTDWRDFVLHDEYFVDIESRLMNPFRFTMGTPETRKEIDLMMFTAQFVVRYGNYFWEVLWDFVGPNSEFHFLDRNHENKLFAQILRAYGCVIQPWSIRPRKFDCDRVLGVLHGFFPALADWKEKQEEEGAELVDKLEVDRRDFVVGDERFRYFLAMEEHIRRPEKLVIPQSQFARPPPVHDKPEPSRWKQPPPLLEEPEPKRGKPDESALVSEEEFLAQHPVESLTNTEEVELRSKIEARGLEVTKVPSKSAQHLNEVEIAKELDKSSAKLDDVDEMISSAIASDPQVKTLLSGTADVWLPVITAGTEERLNFTASLADDDELSRKDTTTNKTSS